MKIPLNPGILQALSAAVLFGAGTPVAKILLGDLSPILLAGLFYFGSGVGLISWFLWQRAHTAASREAPLKRGDALVFSGSVLFGGILAPVFLMFGLLFTPASTTSLLLNLEGIFTTLLAWFIFKENVDRRIALGVAAIALGSVLLSWTGTPVFSLPLGPIAIAGACLCWAVDNNLTRKIAASNPVQIAAIKGLIAGSVNLALGLISGAALPGLPISLLAGVVGFFGYGLSLVLFIFALRHIGAARTSAYFSAAPFIGAVMALVVLHEEANLLFWPAFILMALGLWLHVAERHAHLHVHEALAHSHPHVHDAHHQHRHDFAWNGAEPHTHLHAYESLAHSHPHYPDIHHRHKHEHSD
jgi:drug/metabolite transporter (DMT)-like permease